MRIPLAVLALLPSLAFAAPFSEGQPRQAPAHAPGKPWPQLKAKAKASFSADLGKPVRAITPWHFGQNTSWWSRADWNLHPDRLAKAKAAGYGAWRYPGGSSSDQYFWDGKYGKHTTSAKGDDNTRMTGPTMLDSEGFIQLCKASDGLPMLTLNYGVARYGSLKECIDLALGWLDYFQSKGFPITYVEVGNENYGNWEEGSVVKEHRLTGEEYGQDFLAISKALKAKHPNVMVGAVLCEKDDDKEWSGFFSWNKRLLGTVKDAPDFVIVHNYFIWPRDAQRNYVKPAYEKLLANVAQVGEIRGTFDAGFKAAGVRPDMPIVFNEFNIINGSTPQTIEAVSLPFTAAVLGESIQHGFASTMIWDWRNGLDEKDQGDHASLSHNDKRIPDDTPRPNYYAYAVWAKAGGTQLVGSQARGAGLRGYATRFRDGEAGLVLINETEKAMEVSVELSGFSGKGEADLWCAASADGTWGTRSITFNGQPGPQGGGGPFPLAEPYALQMKGGKAKIALPPVSVTGVVAR